MSVEPNGGQLLGPDPIEEETLRGYKAEHYYPVEIGQTFQSRYKAVGKLGYGSASTVWLCRDLRAKESYVALKVYINCSKEHRELSICQRINSVSSEHRGRVSIRKLLDSFEVEGPHGRHACLAFEPLGNSLGDLKLLADGILKAEVIRETMRPILSALHFLHTVAHVVHTDLQPNNILLGIHDHSVLAEFEREELQEPTPRKRVGDRTIYLSRSIRRAHAYPSLSDFSEARFGDIEHTDLVMPDVYRAPEVVLGMPWSYPIDIWAFAMVVWDLFEPERLFTPRGEDGRYSEEHHLAQMISIIGQPPQDFLQRSKKCKKYWDLDGNWIGNVSIPDQSIFTKERRLNSKDKDHFVDFMRKMLQWKPEDRHDLNDVFLSEWLVADLIESGQVIRDNE